MRQRRQPNEFFEQEKIVAAFEPAGSHAPRLLQKYGRPGAS
jgi:hypothetical protein